MELALLRSLMNKEFYSSTRGAKCPDSLFTSDGKKIKAAIDKAITSYDRDITPDEIQAIFLVDNPSLSTSQKTAYESMFLQIKKQSELGVDVARDVFSKLFQQVLGEEIANLGFDYVNGTQNSLEPLRRILDNHQDNFLPQTDIEWENMSLDYILEKNSQEARWVFNISSLTRKVSGISGGHLIEVGARPNTGKTSFHASLVAGTDGFAEQGAKCVILCNEESAHRVTARYLSATMNMHIDEIAENKTQALAKWREKEKNIFIKDTTGKDMAWVESLCKNVNPDILVLDMGDKFASMKGNPARPDLVLGANAVYARQIAKYYDCAVMYMSQLSAEAEGRVVLNQAMMEGSKTGKAAEADLMVLIAKNPTVEGQDEEDTQRHINIVKNKLTGWHGIVHCDLDWQSGRYTA